MNGRGARSFRWALSRPSWCLFFSNLSTRISYGARESERLHGKCWIREVALTYYSELQQ